MHTETDSENKHRRAHRRDPMRIVELRQNLPVFNLLFSPHLSPLPHSCLDSLVLIACVYCLHRDFRGFN